MKAKILLTGLVAPMVFAACTQEEVFVPQQEAGKIDLSNRPTLGKVTLGFDSQTRATLNEEGLFNSLLWEDGDAVGARIVDTPNLPAVPSFNRFFDYTVCDYASTNYKFEKGAGSVWQSEALMIEGNYMFYAPYDETALYRDPLKMVFPIEQTINPESEQMEKANANTDAIKNFFKDNTTTTVVGYKFLSSKNPEKVVSPTMTHIYAYPQITLKNNYSIDEDSNPSTPAVAKPITIEKVVLSSKIGKKIKKNYKINQSALVNVLKEAYAKTEDVKENGKVVENGNDKAEAGAWTNATKMLQDGRTSTITTSSDDDVTDVTVTFDPALTIAAEGDFKFHVVLPAEEYTDLQATVYLAGSKSFVTGTTAVKFAPAANLTYAPGKRYAKEEYNFEDGEYEIKDGTAGELATFTLQGTIGDYVAPVYIQNAAGFEEFLVALNNNTKTVTEGTDFVLQQKGDYAEMTIDESIVALRNKYLSAGKIIFTSNMNVEGNITLDGNYTFNGMLNQKSGNLTLKTNVAGNATFNGTVTLDGATLGGTATFKAATITSADIKGAIEFKGNATVKTLTSATEATVKSGVVTIDKSSNAALDIDIEGGEVVLNKANYDKDITVGTIKDSKADKAGTLTIGAENALTKVFFNNGTVNINAKVNGVGDSYFSANWKFGTLKVNNNGTIDATSFTNKAKIVNNGTILAKVTNPAGSIIENNATMTVASNEGKIVVAEGSSTYVEAGSAAGTIDNTNKAALFLDGCKNTVTYTFSALQTTEDIENFDAVLYGINKVIFNAGINFNKEFADPTTVFYGVNEIDINGGTIQIAANASMPVNAKVMNITGNVTIDGFKKDVSTLLISHANAMAGKEGTQINVAKNAVLTIKEITVGANKVGSEAEAKLMFNFAKPTAEEATAGVKEGAIKIQNANLYYGAAGTAVSADALDANSSQASKYWNGTAWN